MTRIRIVGKGSQVQPDLSEWSSFFALTFSPLYGNVGVSLFQGSPTISAVDNALEISWDALYAYFRKKDDNQLQERYDRAISEFKTEQDAFIFAFGLMREFQEYLLNSEFVEKRIRTFFTKTNGDVLLRVVISEMEMVKRMIFDSLDMERTLLLRLRDSAGEYRWIGLAADGKPPSTVLQVDTMIEGKPLIFMGSTRPKSPTGKTATPYSSGYTTAIWAGMLHAFENRDAYNEETAIRSALIEHLCKGRVDWEQWMSAGARAGIDPRISDMSVVGGERMAMWKKFAALKMCWDFFDEYYISGAADGSRGGWGEPVGRVAMSAHYYGRSEVITSKVKRYWHSHYQPFEGETDSAGGVCFFPSSNVEGASYGLAFVTNAFNTKGLIKGRAMKYYPLERPIEVVIWKDDPFTIREDDKGPRIILPEEVQFEDSVHPVISETTRSLETMLEATGGGGFRRYTAVIDKVHRRQEGPGLVLNEVKPSEMLETLLIGWRPTQRGNGVVRTNQEDNTYLDMFGHLTFDFLGTVAGQDIPTLLGSALRSG